MIKTKGTKKGLKGTLKLPGDKSISHRAVILGSLAEGTTKINNFLEGEDCINTLKNFKYLGVDIKQKGNSVVVKGVGLHGLQKPNKALDVGNSGTAFRLMTGVLAAQNFITKLTGDKSIQDRPMDRVVEPLKKMGARFSGDKAPLIIFPGKIRGLSYKLPVASAQVKSALLLAGLFSNGKTTVVEPISTRDHTERMFKAFGINLQLKKATPSSPASITLPAMKDRKLKATEVNVPVDISSAAFFIVAALIVPDSKIVIKNVGVNPTRTGIVEALLKMGAKIKLNNKKVISGEPIADIMVQSSSLKATQFAGSQIVHMIDEIPILSVAAAFAEGETTINDAQELRIKESDRIKSICTMLHKFGIKVQENKDGLTITGNPNFKLDKEVHINSYHDHRIAMSALIMGLLNKKETIVSDSKCIDTSFPGFLDHLKKLTK